MKRLSVRTPDASVSAVLSGDGEPLLVLAHGAGGSIDSPFLEGVAEGLAEHEVASLRFNFPYREQGRGAPDREPVLRRTWAAVFEHAATLRRTVWAGGGSMGGRIASMEVADGLPAAGLVLIAYPLHPPGRPERLRAAHLAGIEVPTIVIQGTRDAFARWDLLTRAIERSGAPITLHVVEGADHSFRVPGTKRDDLAQGREIGRIAGGFVRAHAY
ncbi:MAG TPA: alpha/beta family hydrolase [Actinomycetota bacterium]|nr:alpha/beta family hydrolase [Actinomycetota bacterium]